MHQLTLMVPVTTMVGAMMVCVMRATVPSWHQMRLRLRRVNLEMSIIFLMLFLGGASIVQVITLLHLLHLCRCPIKLKLGLLSVIKLRDIVLFLS